MASMEVTNWVTVNNAPTYLPHVPALVSTTTSLITSKITLLMKWSCVNILLVTFVSHVNHYFIDSVPLHS